MNLNLPEPQQPDIFSFGFTRLLNRDTDEIPSATVYDLSDRLSSMAQGNVIGGSLPGLPESVVDL